MSCRVVALTALVVLVARGASAQIAWTLTNQLPGGYVGSVWAASPTEAFASGGYRTLDQFDGTTWSADDHPTGANRYTLFGTGPDDVYSVGQAGYQTGNVLHFDGATWSTVLTTNNELTGVWADGLGSVFTSGDGTLYRFDGSSWQQIDTGLSTAFNTDRLVTIWGLDASDVFVGGYNGLIGRYDGTSFSYTAPFGTGMAIDGFWGSSPHNVYATSNTGLLAHFDGTSWTQVVIPTTAPLFGVFGFGASEIYAVGRAGTLIQFDGSNWAQVATPTGYDLSSIFGVEEGGTKTLFVGVADPNGGGEILEGTSSAANASVAPEPKVIVLLATGLIVLAGARRVD